MVNIEIMVKLEGSNKGSFLIEADENIHRTELRHTQINKFHFVCNFGQENG